MVSTKIPFLLSERIRIGGGRADGRKTGHAKNPSESSSCPQEMMKDNKKKRSRTPDRTKTGTITYIAEKRRRFQADSEIEFFFLLLTRFHLAGKCSETWFWRDLRIFSA